VTAGRGDDANIEARVILGVGPGIHDESPEFECGRELW
jgi:hypothetical protein